MDHRSVRDSRPLSKPHFPFFRPAIDLAGLEGLRKPMGARLEYREIRLRRQDWEELLDAVRAQRARGRRLEVNNVGSCLQGRSSFADRTDTGEHTRHAVNLVIKGCMISIRAACRDRGR